MAEKKTYEQAMERLQEIVAKLEGGEESLESSMKLFEEGAKLSAWCYQQLKDAEQKITELTSLPEDHEDVD